MNYLCRCVFSVLILVNVCVVNAFNPEMERIAEQVEPSRVVTERRLTPSAELSRRFLTAERKQQLKQEREEMHQLQEQVQDLREQKQQENWNRYALSEKKDSIARLNPNDQQSIYAINKEIENSFGRTTKLSEEEAALSSYINRRNARRNAPGGPQ